MNTLTYLVTGGNRGLGLHLTNTFNGTAISRELGGFDITKPESQDAIVDMSMSYDVFVNNAFDGPPHEPWSNFAQTTLLWKIYQKWKEHGKSGHIFNIGSVGAKNTVTPDPLFETYRSSKAALEFASKQCTRAFKDNLVQFKTSLITLDRLDTELTRSRPSWTGNGIDLSDVSNFIAYATSLSNNSIVEETTIYVNFNFKQ